MKRFAIAIFISLAAFSGCFDYITGLEEEIYLAEHSGFVEVPGSGTYVQSDGLDSFTHTISAFRLAKYEVTYEQWYAVYQWAIAHGYYFDNAGSEGHDGTPGAAPTASRYEPVTNMYWRDAMVWCNACSEMTGLTPCYTYIGATINDSRSTNVTACDGTVCSWTASGYRLPTEGEWQYAAGYRDGSSWTPYDYASGATAASTDAAATGLVAWYDANSGSVSHDTGGKTANELGIFDMSGNVWELCWDVYDDYPVTSQTDYRGPGGSGSRIVRGGGWNELAGIIQIGHRDFVGPTSNSNFIGFRLARNM